MKFHENQLKFSFWFMRTIGPMDRGSNFNRRSAGTGRRLKTNLAIRRIFPVQKQFGLMQHSEMRFLVKFRTDFEKNDTEIS
jgi:hypothetical protein